jgi:hypothetical protein
MDVSVLLVLQHKVKRLHFFLGCGGTADIGRLTRAGDLDQVVLDVFVGCVCVTKVCGLVQQ